jgi:hypothetical protein
LGAVNRIGRIDSATPGEFDAADFSYLIRSAYERGQLLGDW